MMEVWNPLGTVGVISAFNFPNAVFGWNAAISFICGNSVVWKNAPASSLITIATSKIIADVFKKNNINPNVFTVLQGDTPIGVAMSKDDRVRLLSFTGSSKIGGIVRQNVESRFGRVLLELGGNNAVIINEDANLDMAFKACIFAAVGTCGQRCTSLRRLFIHEKVYDKFVAKLVKAYSTINIGDPLDSSTLCGPLNNKQSLENYLNTVEMVKREGGKVIYGGKRVNKKGYFVEPTIVEAPQNAPFLQEEYFVPILFLQKFKTLDEAIAMNNGVPQGLSSSLFTQNIANVFKWVGPQGSDCGIVNVNIGPSGAEIGGAFGGEKHTGGGREAGSDSWKQYMRRSTCTINHGSAVPLAQGIKFDV